MSVVSTIRCTKECSQESDVSANVNFLEKMMTSFNFKRENRYSYAVEVRSRGLFFKTQVILTVAGSHSAIQNVEKWIEEYLE